MSNTKNDKLKCVVVTPETTVIDELVDFAAFPADDGEVGVYPRRAPLVARVGCGELRLQAGSGKQRFYVDGGFAQVRDNVLTILTSRAKRANEIDQSDVASQLTALNAEKPVGDDAIDAKLKKQRRLREQLQVAKKQP